MKPNTPIGWPAWKAKQEDEQRWKREGSAQVEPRASDNAPSKSNPDKGGD